MVTYIKTLIVFQICCKDTKLKMKRKLILTGGLGNQMFEYAFLQALRSKGHRIVIDISYYDFFKMHNGYELDRVFGVEEQLINRQGLHIFWLRFLHRFRPKNIYTDDNLVYNPEIIHNPKKYIWGYWQDLSPYQSRLRAS